MLIRRCPTAATAAAILLVGSVAAATPPLPSLTITRAAIDRATHTVDLRLRICFSAGPRALLEIREQRALRGAVKATSRWSPHGVEPQRIAPFACRANWRMNWLMKPELRGPGTYNARIRVRDAYGKWTPPSTLRVTSQ
jgi:hypothetical protein